MTTTDERLADEVLAMAAKPIERTGLWWDHAVCLSRAVKRLTAEVTARTNLLNHIYHEVSTLEDFDADSLRDEIKQAISGEKVFNDNIALHARIEVLTAELATERAARVAAEGRMRTEGTVEVCGICRASSAQWIQSEWGKPTRVDVCEKPNCPIRSARGA